MTLLPDKCWRGRGEVKGGRLWTKPGLKKGEVMALSAWQIPLCLSELAYMYVCHQQILGSAWPVFIALFFPRLRGAGPLCIPHCPSSFLLALLAFLQVSVRCASVFALLLICGFGACFLRVLVCVSWGEHPGLWCWQRRWWWRCRSQGRVLPEGRVVRGEEDGEEEGRGGSWKRGKGLCQCLWVSLNVFSFLQSYILGLLLYFPPLSPSFPLWFLFFHTFTGLCLSLSPCCHSGLWSLSPSPFWIINSPAQGSEWVLLSRRSTDPASRCPLFGSPSI